MTLRTSKSITSTNKLLEGQNALEVHSRLPWSVESVRHTRKGHRLTFPPVRITQTILMYTLFMLEHTGHTLCAPAGMRRRYLIVLLRNPWSMSACVITCVAVHVNGVSTVHDSGGVPSAHMKAIIPAIATRITSLVQPNSRVVSTSQD